MTRCAVDNVQVVGGRGDDGGRPGRRRGRPFLQAAALSFRHPITDALLSFETPLPDELAAVLTGLG